MILQIYDIQTIHKYQHCTTIQQTHYVQLSDITNYRICNIRDCILTYLIYVPGDINKNDVNRRNTLGCLNQFTYRGWRPRKSRDREVVKVSSLHMAIMYFSGDKPGMKFSPHDYYAFSLVAKMGMNEFGYSSWIWPWSSRPIYPPNDRNLNQCVFPFWSKFGIYSLNRCQVISRTRSGLIHRRTKLASGKNVCVCLNKLSEQTVELPVIWDAMTLM